MKKLRLFDSLKFIVVAVVCTFILNIAHAATLPAGYTELEYIQSTGTQYIDTERVPNNNDIIEQKFQKVGDSTTTCSWYGSMPSSQVVTPRIGIGSFRAGTVLSIFVGLNYTSTISSADTNVHTLRFQATGEKELTYTFDGVTSVMATTANMYEPAVELTSYLFARHGTNGVQVYDNEGTKIYYHREYLANGTLVLNMIPVKRNSDNALGMYDTVSGQFFTNAGTGEFVAGPAVPIKIATTRYNEEQFEPVETRLDAARTVINDLITQMQTNAVNVSKLAVEKQTRPNADCPAGKNCLLVTDPTGAENWYEIVGADAVESSSNVPDYFSFTTTALNAGDSVGFRLTPSGTFTVDWGDGSTPQVIERTNTTSETYSHSYSNAGAKTVKITGRATGYSTDSTTSVLSFGNASRIASIDGCLGAIFPTLGNASGQQPRFYETFYSTPITSIPAGLFSGITGATPYMFYNTFSNTPITSIPAGLFSGINGAAGNMFVGTFAGTRITSIPAGLFRGVTGAAGYMFNQTFAGTRITSIPENLFSGVTGAAEGIFYYTFISTPITSIPAGLFSGVTGAEDYMFYGTFSYAKITSIPENLFSGVTGAAGNMFYDTFSYTKITSIPENLFSSITGAAGGMFSGTFSGTPITSIPAGLFRGITGAANYMFSGTFADTQITSIPENLFSGITGAANYMFSRTFQRTKITSIPENLFSGITSAASWMFSYTFENCSNLTGYIPESTFAGLIQNYSPYKSNFMKDMFTNSTGMATECPSGTTEVQTGYKSTYWSTGNGNYAVMCRPN